MVKAKVLDGRCNATKLRPESIYASELMQRQPYVRNRSLRVSSGHCRFDGEGTPQFHQSLSRVPAGLTPIRTRSEDYEADLAADSRALAVLHKVAARQVTSP